jgi:uncharacterized protein
MAKIEKDEFESFISDIVLNKDFNKLSFENHHGITRYEHSMRVAKYTYNVCKKTKNKRIKEVTRAALLHDFFINNDLKDESSSKKLKLHPEVALANAKKYYEIDKIQEDIIVKHMFPITLSFPKYKESWLVSFVDKFVGLYEMVRFKLPLYTSIYLLFIIQFITIPR